MSSIKAIVLGRLTSGGGGSDISVEPLSVTKNGTTVAPSSKAYSPVSVNVPNTYTAADEGKVVDNGVLVAQTSLTVTANGTVDTTVNDEVTVNVQPALQSKTATENGTVTPDSGYDGLSQVSVNVQPVLETLSVTDNGEYTPGAGVDGFSSVSVNVSGGGGGSVPSNDVNFRDYDGTIVNAYSAADFANLTAMPANPSHSGLTAQGWNWSLADAKAYVSKYGRLEIGQMYITDDGKTRVYIHLEQGRTSPMLGVCPNGTVDVDWGDGTAHDTLTGTSTSAVKWTPNHAYAAPGDYVIKLTVTGSMGFYGSSSINQYSGLLLYTSSGDSRNYVYRNAIQKVEIGSSVTSIGSYAFYYCYSLANITIPDSVTSIGSYAFSNCYSLANITIPDGARGFSDNAFSNCYSLANITIPDSVTSIGSYAFYYCYSLANITIPDSITSIVDSAFYSCYSLASVTIPDGVTSIGSGAFRDCYSLASVTIPDIVTSIDGSAFRNCNGVAEYHLASTTPPTLSNANAFSNIQSDCIIYVPYSADHSVLEAYKTASNWSTYASKMQEEPQ